MHWWELTLIRVNYCLVPTRFFISRCENGNTREEGQRRCSSSSFPWSDRGAALLPPSHGPFHFTLIPSHSHLLSFLHDLNSKRLQRRQSQLECMRISNQRSLRVWTFIVIQPCLDQAYMSSKVGAFSLPWFATDLVIDQLLLVAFCHFCMWLKCAQRPPVPLFGCL